jgi:hypothetical protein
MQQRVKECFINHQLPSTTPRINLSLPTENSCLNWHFVPMLTKFSVLRTRLSSLLVSQSKVIQARARLYNVIVDSDKRSSGTIPLNDDGTNYTRSSRQDGYRVGPCYPIACDHRHMNDDEEELDYSVIDQTGGPDSERISHKYPPSLEGDPSTFELNED